MRESTWNSCGRAAINFLRILCLPRKFFRSDSALAALRSSMTPPALAIGVAAARVGPGSFRIPEKEGAAGPANQDLTAWREGTWSQMAWPSCIIP